MLKFSELLHSHDFRGNARNFSFYSFALHVEIETVKSNRAVNSELLVHIAPYGFRNIMWESEKMG